MKENFKIKVILLVLIIVFVVFLEILLQNEKYIDIPYDFSGINQKTVLTYEINDNSIISTSYVNNQSTFTPGMYKKVTTYYFNEERLSKVQEICYVTYFFSNFLLWFNLFLQYSAILAWISQAFTLFLCKNII